MRLSLGIGFFETLEVPLVANGTDVLGFKRFPRIDFKLISIRFHWSG